MLTFSRIRLVELIDDKTIYRYHHSDNENVLRASKPSAHGLAMKLAFVIRLQIANRTNGTRKVKVTFIDTDSDDVLVVFI